MFKYALALSYNTCMIRRHMVQALDTKKRGSIKENFGGVLIFDTFIIFGSLNTDRRFANENFPRKCYVINIFIYIFFFL